MNFEVGCRERIGPGIAAIIKTKEGGLRGPWAAVLDCCKEMNSKWFCKFWVTAPGCCLNKELKSFQTNF
jgi:hypothetical protein